MRGPGTSWHRASAAALQTPTWASFTWRSWP